MRYLYHSDFSFAVNIFGESRHPTPVIDSYIGELSTEIERGRVQVKQIKNKTSQQVMFSKRRSGPLKKAHKMNFFPINLINRCAHRVCHALLFFKITVFLPSMNAIDNCTFLVPLTTFTFLLIHHFTFSRAPQIHS